MDTIDTIRIGSDDYELKDATARETADTAGAQQEYDRQAVSGTYPGRDLSGVLGASSITDLCSKLHAMAQAQDAGGLRIGDYMTVTPTRGSVNRGADMVARLAGIGHGYQFGDNACPWALWFVIDSPVDMTGSSYAVNTSYIPWNTSNTNNGTSSEKRPYLASNLHRWELGEFLLALPAALQDVLVDHRILFEERWSGSGALSDSTSWSWGDAGKVFSLSETEVYGQCVWGTKGYSVGADAQLPLFRDSRYRLSGGRVNWWLRSVGSGSSSSVCYVDADGSAGDSAATAGWVRPRPCFLVG